MQGSESHVTDCLNVFLGVENRYTLSFDRLGHSSSGEHGFEFLHPLLESSDYCVLITNLHLNGTILPLPIKCGVSVELTTSSNLIVRVNFLGEGLLEKSYLAL